MTTYTKLRNLIATLYVTKAELENMVAVNTGDHRADSFFLEASQKINNIINALEARQQFVVKEEPQFEESHEAQTKDAEGERQ